MVKTTPTKSSTGSPAKVLKGPKEWSYDDIKELRSTFEKPLSEIVVDADGGWKVKELLLARSDWLAMFNVDKNKNRTFWVDTEKAKLEVANAINEEKLYQLFFVRKTQSTTTYVFKETSTGKMVKRNTLDGLFFIKRSIFDFLQRERKYKKFLCETPVHFGQIPAPRETATTLSGAIDEREQFDYNFFPTTTANKGKPYLYHGTHFPIARCDVVNVFCMSFGGVKNGILINYCPSGSGWLVDVGERDMFSTILIPTKDLKFVRRCGDDTLLELGGYSYLRKTEEKFPTDMGIAIGDTVKYQPPTWSDRAKFKVTEIYGYGEDGLLIKHLYDDLHFFANIKDVEYQPRVGRN